MSTKLYGYGDKSVTTDGDYDIQCIRLDEPRAALLTTQFTFGTYDGTVTMKSRRRGSTGSFGTQAYVKQDGSISSAAISSDMTIQLDATGKDLRFTTAGRTTGTLTAGFDVADEA